MTDEQREAMDEHGLTEIAVHDDGILYAHDDDGSVYIVSDDGGTWIADKWRLL